MILYRRLISGNILFLILIVFSVSFSFAQKKGKDFYLIDLNEKSIGAYDKKIMDSILVIYHNSSVDSIKITYVRYLAESLFDQNLWPKYNKLLFEMLQGKKGKFCADTRAIALNNFGYEAQYIKNDLFKAKQFYYDSYNEFKNTGTQEGMASEINNLAFIYQHEGNIEKAIELYSEALTIFLKLKNDRGLASEYLNLGDIYFRNKDYEKAEESFTKALFHSKRSNNKVVEANVLNQLGNIYRFKGLDSKAHEYYLNSYKIYAEVGEKSKMALSLSNINEYLIKTKKFAEAEGNYREALAFAMESGNSQILSTVYSNYANYWILKGNNDLALKFTDSAYKHSKLIGYPDLILKSSQSLSNLWMKKSDFKRAYNYLAEAFAMRDSINNDVIRKATIKSQYKTEYEVKEVQLKAEEEKKDVERKLEKNRQQIITYAALFALLSMTIVAYVVYRNFRSKKRSTILLEEKNRIILNQKGIVEEKQKEILDSIHYAKRIQNALITNENFIDRTLNRLIKK